MDLELNNKVALVTDGAHGLGRAVCLALAAEGARVAINYHRHPDEAESLAAEIRDRFAVEACAVGSDVSFEADVVAMFESVEQRLGVVEILVNKAEVCPTGRITETTAVEWNKTLAVNLGGAFLTSREFVRRLIPTGRKGRIVNVASQAAFRGLSTGHVPYDASQGGLVSLTISLAGEMAAQGVAVNAVALGSIRSDLTTPEDANSSPCEATIPLGRLGEPAEVADMVVFLASERASYMTGATVDCTGGVLMR